MELHLTSEQTLLRDSAAKFLATAAPKAARGSRNSEVSSVPGRLRKLGELGWVGMLVPSSADGAGSGLTEMALVLEQAGRTLAWEPIGLAIIAAAALAQGHAPHPILRLVMAGDALVVPALEESAHDPLALRTEAIGSHAPRLTGTKTSVCADGADGFLVSATGSDGPALYYLPRDTAGVSITTAPTADGRTLARLELKDAPADLVPPRQSSRSAVEALTDLALIALSAELLGVMEGAQELTFEYLRVRKQFGKPIGAFQALQHKAVDIYIKTETVRSLLYQVAAANDPYRIEPALAVAVKAKASEDALSVTQTCIQLHGAIGFTDEHDIGLYLKRALLLSSLLGNAAAQRRRYIELTEMTV
jgi:alkylation response protein AidB-like acyl-CoA dehydrogenase